MKYALLPFVLLLGVNEVIAAEPLGRLFFTPAQRAQLDGARDRKSRAPLAAEQEQTAPVPEVVTYGGLVRRSDGRSTVWINNHVINDGKAGDRWALTSRVQPDGSVSVEMPQTNRNVKLKVGQSVDIGSGTIEEPYARRASAAKPASGLADKSAGARTRAAQPAAAASPLPRTRDLDDEQDPRPESPVSGTVQTPQPSDGARQHQ